MISIGPRIGVTGEAEFRMAFREMASYAENLKKRMDNLTDSFSKNDSEMSKNIRTTENLRDQISQYNKIIEQTEDIIKKSIQAEKDLVKQHEEDEKNIPLLQQRYEELGKDIEYYTTWQGTASQKVKDLKAEQKDVGDALKQTQKRYENFNTEQLKATKNTTDWKTKLLELEGGLSKLERELVKGPNYVEEFANQTESARMAMDRFEKEVGMVDSRLQATQASYSKWTSEFTKTGDKSKSLTDKLAAQEKALKQNNDLYDRAKVALDKQQKEYDDLCKKLEQTKKEYGENSKEAKLLSDALFEQDKILEKAKQNVQEYADKQVKLQGDIAGTKRELDDLPSKLTLFNNALDSGAGIVSGWGDNLTKYVTAPLTALSTASVKAASDFQDGMAKVYTIADDSVVSMEDMSNALRDMSNDTGFSLTDLAEAAYLTVSSAVKTGDAIDFVSDATNLARAGFTSTTGAVDILTTAINAYGMSVEDASYISDVLLRTQNDGKTVVDELASSMGTVIPTAAAYNVSLENLAAAYIVMTKRGINTARSTTFLNSMFTELERESSDVSKILEDKTGKSFAQLMDQGYNLADVLAIIYRAVGSDEEKFARLWKNVRAGRGGLALVTSGGMEQFAEAMERVATSTGLTQKALDTLNTPGLRARKTLTRLKNSSVEFGKILMDELSPAFDWIVEHVEKFAVWMTKLDEPTKHLIFNATAFLTAIGPVFKLIGGSIGVITRVVSSFQALGNVFTYGLAAMGPLQSSLVALGPSIAVIVAALGAGYVAQKYFDEQLIASIEATHGLTEEQKGLISSSQELHDQFESTRQATAHEVSEINHTYDAVDYLINGYNSLIDEQGKVKEGSEAMADVYLTQLASTLGITKEEVMKLTEENGKLGESIEQLIEKQKQQAIIEAYADDYKEAISARKDAQKNYLDLVNETGEAYDKWQKAEQELADWKAQEGTMGYFEYVKGLKELTYTAGIAKNAYDDLHGQMETAQNDYVNATNTITNYEQAMAAVASGSDNAGETIERLQNNLVGWQNGTEKTLKAQADEWNSYYEQLQKGFEEGQEGITKEMVEQAETIANYANEQYELYVENSRQKGEDGATAFADGAKSKQDYVKNKTAEIVNAAGIEADKGKTKLGNSGKESGKAYGDGVDTEANKQNASSGGAAVANAANAGAKGADNSFQLGSDWAAGYARGIRSFEGKVKDAGYFTVKTVERMTAATQVSSSPSKVAAKLGSYWTQGYALGIESEMGAVKDASKQIVNSAIGAGSLINGYSPNPYGDVWYNTRTVSAPISVSVNVNGNVEDYDELADTIANRINESVLRKQGVFG